jgi:hypothetical protein
MRKQITFKSLKGGLSRIYVNGIPKNGKSGLTKNPKKSGRGLTRPIRLGRSATQLEINNWLKSFEGGQAFGKRANGRKPKIRKRGRKVKQQPPDFLLVNVGIFF